MNHKQPEIACCDTVLTVVPVVLAALMKHMIDALVSKDAVRVVNVLTLQRAGGGPGDVADDVEDRDLQFWGLARERLLRCRLPAPSAASAAAAASIATVGG